MHFSWKKFHILRNTIVIVTKVGLWLRLMYMLTNDNNVVTYHDEVKLICIVRAYSHFVTYQIAEIILPAVGQPFHI